MRYASMATLATALLGLAGPGAARPAQSGLSECQVFRILPDGRKIRATAEDVPGADVQVSTSPYGASAASAGSGSVSSRSSVSISSSSGSNATARATSSYTDEQGRLVTVTRDRSGCTIVIDERSPE